MSQREGSLGQAFVAAIQFLTRIPVPVEVPFTNAVLKRSTLFFPVAGLLVGLATWGGGWLLQQVLPVMPAAALTLLIMLGMTGGLHLDGLMDTADGILSHRSRERMLEIMKDSRVCFCNGPLLRPAWSRESGTCLLCCHSSAAVW